VALRRSRIAPVRRRSREDRKSIHLRGVPWARIGEFVGQRNPAVTANTYTHVLTDEAELDYAALLCA
jgi:hypothetical protein